MPPISTAVAFRRGKSGELDVLELCWNAVSAKRALSVSGVGKHAKMPATAAVGLGPIGGRSHESTAKRTGGRITETPGEATRGGTDTGGFAFAHCVGKRDQVIVVGVGRQRAGVANQLPAARGGDAAGVQDAKIPGVRLRHGGQRTHFGRGVRIDERERRDRIVRAPRPAAATGNIHSGRLACSVARMAPDTRGRPAPESQPLRF